ncbi:hypothetical protein K466DRAFT_267084 [Polyporus arcularius HHB13444]|uniref:Uncharacterized protein n=1 Tax=Polyporus arcularius HHB13444 TaxID=1314778 RepID=A0A5C3P228_9APHY|nr:hypothetical protein K466DRAFT_267084 [Polyporus arcularius HHB13444]
MFSKKVEVCVITSPRNLPWPADLKDPQGPGVAPSSYPSQALQSAEERGVELANTMGMIGRTMGFTGRSDEVLGSAASARYVHSSTRSSSIITAAAQRYTFLTRKSTQVVPDALLELQEGVNFGIRGIRVHAAEVRYKPGDILNVSVGGDGVQFNYTAARPDLHCGNCLPLTEATLGPVIRNMQDAHATYDHGSPGEMPLLRKEDLVLLYRVDQIGTDLCLYFYQIREKPSVIQRLDLKLRNREEEAAMAYGTLDIPNPVQELLKYTLSMLPAGSIAIASTADISLIYGDGREPFPNTSAEVQRQLGGRYGKREWQELTSTFRDQGDDPKSQASDSNRRPSGKVGKKVIALKNTSAGIVTRRDPDEGHQWYSGI